MTEYNAGHGARRPRSSRTTAAIGSPGLPGSEGDDRVAELEARLDRLEGGPGMRDRGQALIRKVMPAEAGHHFRNAAREQLLGFRAIVDFWIRRVDAMDSGATEDNGRESISID
ncbi:MAG TPA: hypothetical protein VNH13_04620 [Candidatus Acidoferrales bacterium]|jgi:hypothetical protein|nr:hypothetical protein [Candidatus Acidoferrales bacterium]